MLKHLYVKNFALIHQLDLNVGSGLTVITGETGAGKSILLGALNHILGQRADLKSLRDTSQKCVIEGEFEIEPYNLQTFFEEQDLDYSHQTILRREILPSGKSRAFINDSPVNLTQLKALGEQLVDIHSQHQTLLLQDEDFQLNILDYFSGNHSLLDDYQKAYKTYKKAQLTLNKRKEEQQKALADQDYYTFQLNELEELKLDELNQEELEEELNTLSHTEEIKTVLYKCTEALSGEQNGVHSTLNELLNDLRKISGYSETFASYAERMESVRIELEDLAAELEDKQSDLEHNPERIITLNDTVNKLNALQQKHLVNTVEALIAKREEFRGKVEDVASIDDQIHVLESEVEQLQEQVNALAQQLSEKRNSHCEALQKEVENLLHQLGMPHAVLAVDIKTVPMYGLGIDEVDFLFSANKGNAPKSLASVASGGELSRVMLSLKYLLSRLKKLPTIIFDEIDTGVSGGIAAKIATMMQEMAAEMQVLTITHLPQVAGKGVHHIKVYKEVSEETTETQLIHLSEQERVEELAKMLSGDQPTEAARSNARELLLGAS